MREAVPFAMFSIIPTALIYVDRISTQGKITV